MTHKTPEEAVRSLPLSTRIMELAKDAALREHFSALNGRGGAHPPHTCQAFKDCLAPDCVAVRSLLPVEAPPPESGTKLVCRRCGFAYSATATMCDDPAAPGAGGFVCGGSLEMVATTPVVMSIELLSASVEAPGAEARQDEWEGLPRDREWLMGVADSLLSTVSEQIGRSLDHATKGPDGECRLCSLIADELGQALNGTVSALSRPAPVEADARQEIDETDFHAIMDAVQRLHYRQDRKDKMRAWLREQFGSALSRPASQEGQK